VHAPPGVAALGDGARVGERLLAGHGEGDHGVEPRPRLVLAPLGEMACAQVLEKPPDLRGVTSRLRPCPPYPSPYRPGTLTVLTKVAHRRTECVFSGRYHVSSYSSVYGIFAAVQRIAATRRESIT